VTRSAPYSKAPPKRRRKGVERAVSEEVAFGDDDRDVFGRVAVVEPVADGEVRVVQSHIGRSLRGV